MDGNPSTPSAKSYKLHHHRPLRRHPSLLPKLALCTLLAVALLAFFLLSPRFHSSLSYLSSSSRTVAAPSAPWGGAAWEKRVRASARPRPSPSQHRRPLSVLVIGAAGFLGTHVSSALRRRGDGVLGLDSFHLSPSLPLKRSRQSLLSRSGVFVVHGDARDQALLRKLLDVHPFTHVLHLASSPSLPADLAALVSLLEASRSADPQPAFVWASSSAVYGLNPGQTPASESDRTDRPATLDAAAKKSGEEITHAYNHIYGLSVTALRFFGVYGPWGHHDSAYFSFTRDILRRKPISIFEGDDGYPLARDLTYIDDAVRGCLAALDTAEKSTGRGGKKRAPAQMRVYNLGSGSSPVPVTELVDILEELLKVKAERKGVRTPRAVNARFMRANITLAQRELGYLPATDLKTGMKRFVRWYLQYNEPNSPLRKKGSR